MFNLVGSIFWKVTYVLLHLLPSFWAFSLRLPRVSQSLSQFLLSRNVVQSRFCSPLGNIFCHPEHELAVLSHFTTIIYNSGLHQVLSTLPWTNISTAYTHLQSSYQTIVPSYSITVYKSAFKRRNNNKSHYDSFEYINRSRKEVLLPVFHGSFRSRLYVATWAFFFFYCLSSFPEYGSFSGRRLSFLPQHEMAVLIPYEMWHIHLRRRVSPSHTRSLLRNRALSMNPGARRINIR